MLSYGGASPLAPTIMLQLDDDRIPAIDPDSLPGSVEGIVQAMRAAWRTAPLRMGQRCPVRKDVPVGRLRAVVASAFAIER